MAHVDFKVTAWEKVDIKEENIEDVIALIKSGEIQTSNDLINNYPQYLEDEETGNYRIIEESETSMSVEENEGYATIEVDASDEIGANIVYKNGK